MAGHKTQLLSKEIVMKTPLFWLKWMAKHNGKIDGRKNIPTIDQEIFPFYELNLKKLFESNIQLLTREWQEKDQKLKEEYCKVFTTADNLREQIKEKEPAFEETLKDRNRFSREFEHMHTVSKGYWVLMLFLAVCEFPMNSIVFDILGEAKWLTYLLAAGVCVVVPLAAHYMGIVLKRESPLKHASAALKAAVLFLSVAAVLLGLAYMRERFVAGSGVAELLGIKMDARMVTVIFLSINLLIFVVASFASYMAHIDVTEQEIKDYSITRRELKEAEELLASQGGNLERLKKVCDEMEEKISKIAVAREKVFQQHKEIAEAYRDTCLWLINVYRTKNMRVRENSEVPACFQGKPVVSIAPFDGDIDEKC